MAVDRDFDGEGWRNQNDWRNKGFYDSYYRSPEWSGTGLAANPYYGGMQAMMLGSMNNGPNFANSFNQGWGDYNRRSLAAMPYQNQAQGIANQRLNFKDLVSALPGLFGHILGPQAAGFNTDYGASATMGSGGGSNPGMGSGLAEMLKKFT